MLTNVDELVSRVSHLHFFWIFISFQAGMNARHTKEQEKYRSSMLYVHNFFLILTFVSYKLRQVAVDKGYSSEIDFEVIKLWLLQSRLSPQLHKQKGMLV